MDTFDWSYRAARFRPSLTQPSTFNQSLGLQRPVTEKLTSRAGTNDVSEAWPEVIDMQPRSDAGNTLARVTIDPILVWLIDLDLHHPFCDPSDAVYMPL